MRIIIILLIWSGAVGAVGIEGKEFRDSITVNGKTLVLNGVGLRSKKKLGMSFRVYVGGLYVTAKTSDPAKVIEPGDKVLELIFLRSVDKDALHEAWTEAFKKNCKVDCDQSAAGLKSFNDLMTDVREDSRLTLRFDAKGVDVEISGKKAKTSARIEGAPFTRNLMSVFVGSEPPTEELKKGLLGG